MEGVNVRVVDDEGNDVPPGRTGRRASRGPNVFVGYLKDKKITDGAPDDDGWFLQRGFSVRDEAGTFTLLTVKDMDCPRRRENLNSNEINDWLKAALGMGVIFIR